jgi:hypothetical protein
MKYIYPIIVVLLYLNSINLKAQTFNSYIYSKDELEPLEEATIFNRNTKIITTSNDKGFFEIKAGKNDTLEIRKLGYNQIISLAEEFGQKILMDRTQIYLSTIFITNAKEKKLNKKINKNFQLGLNYLGTYAFKINIENKGIITKIELPFNNRPYYSKNGSINFQVYKTNKDEFNLKTPISDVIKINNIKRLENYITLDFVDFEVNETSYYYLAVSRNIPNAETSKLSESFSLNPFLLFDNKGEENDFKYKFNGTDKWNSSSTFYNKDKPAISAIIYGIENPK